MALEQVQKNIESRELDMAAKHNIEAAIQTVLRKNNCSYGEAVKTVKNFVDFLKELIDGSVKAPGWDEKSGSIPYNYDKHEIFEVGEGEDKRKIKMGGEANITYAAHVLQNKNRSALKDAFGEVNRWADFLLEENEKIKAKRK